MEFEFLIRAAMDANRRAYTHGSARDPLPISIDLHAIAAAAIVACDAPRAAFHAAYSAWWKIRHNALTGWQEIEPPMSAERIAHVLAALMRAVIADANPTAPDSVEIWNPAQSAARCVSRAVWTVTCDESWFCFYPFYDQVAVDWHEGGYDSVRYTIPWNATQRLRRSELQRQDRDGVQGWRGARSGSCIHRAPIARVPIRIRTYARAASHTPARAAALLSPVPAKTWPRAITGPSRQSAVRA